MVKLGALEIFVYIGFGAVVAFLLLPRFMAFALTVGVLGSYIAYVIKRYRFFDEIGLPYVKSMPFVGMIMQMTNADGMHHLDMQWGPKLGKIFGTYFIGYVPDFVVWDPELLKNVLVKDFSVFTNRRVDRPNKLRKATTVDEFDMVNNMITVAADDHWKHIRSSMTPIFTSGKLKSIFNLMDDKGPLWVDVIRERGESGAKDIDVKKMVGGFTMNIIASVALGDEVDSLRNPDDPLVTNATSVNNFKLTDPRVLFKITFPWLTIKLYEWFWIRILKMNAEDYFKYTLAETLKHRVEGKSAPKNDFMQLMLNTRKNAPEGDHDEGVGFSEAERKDSSLGKVTRKPMSDEQIVTNCFLFLVAGFDTSAVTLNFACYNLAVNPEVQQKCFEELNRVLKEDTDLHYEDVMQNLPYLEAVIMETLRMYPPAPSIDRMASVNYKLTDNIVVPKGSAVRVPIYLIHHWDEYYPDPEQFDPDRFLPEERAKRDPLLYLPFGYGPRSCVALRFAMMEMKIVLIYMIKHFILKPSESTEIPLSLTSMNLLRPKNDIMLRFEPRS